MAALPPDTIVGIVLSVINVILTTVMIVQTRGIREGRRSKLPDIASKIIQLTLL